MKGTPRFQGRADQNEITGLWENVIRITMIGYPELDPIIVELDGEHHTKERAIVAMKDFIGNISRDIAKKEGSKVVEFIDLLTNKSGPL